MKRILYVCITIMIATLFLPTQSYAAGTNRYYIKECEISVDVPNDFITVTREIDENDTALQQLQLSKTDLLDILEDRGIYLDSTTTNGIFELWVSAVKTDYDINLNDISDEKLLSEFGSILDTSNTGTIKYSSLSIYKSPTKKYIKAYGTATEGDTSYSTIQYMTVYNKHFIYVAGASYDGPITNDQELQLQTMVDNVSFGNKSSQNDSNEYSESNPTYNGYEYTDQESDVVFFVPKNWHDAPFNTAPEYLSVKFVNTDDTKYSIMYGSMDCYSALSDEEKRLYTRESIDNSYLLEDTNESELIDLIGLESGEVSSTTYNGKNYITLVGSYNYNSDGFSITFPAKYCIHLENGWMYTFAFLGGIDSEQYADFESLIKSVKYPIQTETLNSASNTSVYDGNNTAHRSSYVVIIVLCVCLGCALIGLVIYILKRKSSTNEAQGELKLCSPGAKDKHIKYCYKCGAEIRFNNKYCSNCGVSLRQNTDNRDE